MLQAIVGALCGVGLFFVLADVYRIPYLKTSKAVESLSKKQKVKTSTLNVWLGNLADFLAKHMKLERCSIWLLYRRRGYSVGSNFSAR